MTPVLLTSRIYVFQCSYLVWLLSELEWGADKLSLSSIRIPAGNLTYFIDVRVAKNNKNYLNITQTGAQGKQRVIVFADNIQKFADALKPALDLFNKQKLFFNSL